MKKLIILAASIAVLSSNVIAAETNQKLNNVPLQKPAFEHRVPPTREQIEQHKKAHEAMFEQKLGLTEVQKLKAKEQRKAGFEKIKPVMQEIKSKKAEAMKIQDSNETVQVKEEKLTVIDKDIAELQKQAAKIRKQNMKDFESILTNDQKKVLKQMKKDGRNKYQKEHKKGNMVPRPFPPKTPEFEK